jgi:hypothetical protein
LETRQHVENRGFSRSAMADQSNLHGDYSQS